MNTMTKIMKRLLLLFIATPMISFGKYIEPENMKGMLAAHNKYRSELGIPNLVWSNKLAASSQKWANELQRRGCEIEHSDSQYGENIAWNSGFNETPAFLL